MKKALLGILLLFALITPTLAMEQGAYGVYCGTNYWNPDTGNIDDGGTANAALGEGMCRSATATTALVEKDGDNYYVTIRLLLQSNTKDVIFWQHTGYDSYVEVNYDIIAEDAVSDSIDYRFKVSDPFAPIRASMYVTPMGRATLWYIELDESSLGSDTGDFVVSVSAAVIEEEIPADDSMLNAPTTETVETSNDVGVDAHIDPSPEETSPLEESDDTEIDEAADETTDEDEPEDDTLVPPLETAEPEEEKPSSPAIYISLAVLVLAAVGFVIIRKKKS